MNILMRFPFKIIKNTTFPLINNYFNLKLCVLKTHLNIFCYVFNELTK